MTRPSNTREQFLRIWPSIDVPQNRVPLFDPNLFENNL